MKYLSILFFALLLLSCHGWGYALTRWSATRDQYPFAFLSVIGVAVLIFLGGVLNLVRLAYPLALGILFLTGLTFFAIYCAENAKAWLAAWRANGPINLNKLKSISGQVVPIGILITAVSFYALTLLPSFAFNFADDFQTYIPRLSLMLQTGTMTGNPFDVLGLDLGAHTFLLGFVLLGLPIEYLLGLDAVFCFALTGMLLIAIGKKFNLHWSYTTFALLGFIVINPQSVNISALYIGSALILGVLFASCLLLDQIEKSVSDELPMISSVILGLFFTSVIVIKTSFASYVLAYSFLFFIGLLLISKDKRKIVKIGGLVMLSACLALLPWLLLHATNFASTVHSVLHPATVVVENSAPLRQAKIIELFSRTDLFYGNSFLSYGIIVLMLFALGAYILIKTFGNKITPSQRGYFLVAAASCAAGIISYLFIGTYTIPRLAVRYSCPVLIAILPFALLAASMAVSNALLPAKSLNLRGMKIAIMLSLSGLIVIVFWNNFILRIERAYYQNATLSFPIDDNYIQYSRNTTSPDARQKIREIQSLTQPAQKILAWIDMPGHLDFSRNEIYAVREMGLASPWLDMPFDGDSNDMIQYLKDQGIRYIMWEYDDKNGLAKEYRRWLSNPFDDYRMIGERALYLRRTLAAIVNEGGGSLYHANGMVLFDLQ